MSSYNFKADEQNNKLGAYKRLALYIIFQSKTNDVQIGLKSFQLPTTVFLLSINPYLKGDTQRKGY